MRPLEAGTVDSLRELEEHGGDSSTFLALHVENQHFRTPGVDGFLPYRRRGRLRVQFGGPICADGDKDTLLAAFLADATVARERVIAFQLCGDDAVRQERQGFRVNQFGASYSIHLPEFSMSGQKMVKTRNMISRARREGSEVAEAPEPAALAGQLDDIDSAWLRDKGRLARRLDFMVGSRDDGLDSRRRLFTASVNGRVMAYVTYSPVYGREAGWLYDLTRRHPDAPPGVIEQLLAAGAEAMRAEGTGWLHMGFTPFVDLAPEHALPSALKGTDRVMRLLLDYGRSLYDAKSQRSFKLKWRPQLVTPEYVAARGTPGPTDIWRLARVVNAV